MNAASWLVIVFSGRGESLCFFRDFVRIVGENYEEISGNNGSLPAIFMTLYGKLVKTEVNTSYPH